VQELLSKNSGFEAGDKEEKDALVKTSFHSDDNPLAPALPQSGVGAHCNAPGMKQM